MGQLLSAAWNEVGVSSDAVSDLERPRSKAIERTAGFLSQDPRSPGHQGNDVDRTPIQLKKDTNFSAGDSKDCTPVSTKVLPFDPRSPGIDRSPIVIAAEDGSTPVRGTPVLKSKSLAFKLSQSLRQKALHKSSE